VEQICRKLKIDRNRYTIKIIYRYPQVFQQSNLVFAALEIADDEDLGLLFGTVMSLQEVVRGVELYVESVPVEVQNSVDAPTLQENQEPVEENPEVQTEHTQRLTESFTRWDSHLDQMMPQSDPQFSQWGSHRSQSPPQHDPQPSQRVSYHDYFSGSPGHWEFQWSQMPPQSDLQPSQWGEMPPQHTSQRR